MKQKELKTIRWTSSAICNKIGWIAMAILLVCCESELIDQSVDVSFVEPGESVSVDFSLSDIESYSGGTVTRGEVDNDVVSEWVNVCQDIPVQRSAEDVICEQIPAATLDIVADSTDVHTRANIVLNNVFFRVIAYLKNGNSYTYAGQCDYQAKGASAATAVNPTGGMRLKAGVYKFVAYSFNLTSNTLGAALSNPVYNGTNISVPNMNNDFMTCETADLTIPVAKPAISLSFVHKFCQVAINVAISGFSPNTVTVCNGIYTNAGGSGIVWKVGPAGNNLTYTAGNSPSVSNATGLNSAAVWSTQRILPITGKKLRINFTNLKIGGRTANASYVETSANVAFQPGGKYTIKINYKPRVGIRVAAADNESKQSTCTADSKNKLATLTWAPSNLNEKNTFVGGISISHAYGAYFTYYSTYTGKNTTNGIDPCSKVTLDGGGWRTPSDNELHYLANCVIDKQVVTTPAKGMWFMSKTVGLLLPAAGGRYGGAGSSTVGNNEVGTGGNYWGSLSRDNEGLQGYAWTLYFYGGSVTHRENAHVNTGCSVRCVKGTKY